MERYKGKLKGKSTLCGVLSLPQKPSGAYQEKQIILSDVEQVIMPDKGFTAMRSVTIAAIPSNYGRISFNGYELEVE